MIRFRSDQVRSDAPTKDTAVWMIVMMEEVRWLCEILKADESERDYMSMSMSALDLFVTQTFVKYS